jgi:hypothetical protein
VPLAWVMLGSNPTIGGVDPYPDKRSACGRGTCGIDDRLPFDRLFDGLSLLFSHGPYSITAGPQLSPNFLTSESLIQRVFSKKPSGASLSQRWIAYAEKACELDVMQSAR